MKNFIYLLSLLFLFSCAEEVPDMPTPKKFISKGKMIDLLTEIMELESRAQTKYVQLSNYSEILEKEVDSILISKGYSSLVFEENMNYYGSRQDEMIEMYEEVKKKLQIKKTQITD
jgi:heterodisulfide reductase subunit A-like polyferredoxin